MAHTEIYYMRNGINKGTGEVHRRPARQAQEGARGAPQVDQSDHRGHAKLDYRSGVANRECEC